MKSITKRKLKGMLIAAPIAMSMGMINTAWGFDSGSTGADGPLNPIVDTELALPPDGIFNYTSVNIPVGVTITFARNVTNTPVVMLVSGDFTLDGTINIAGSNSPHTGPIGDGNLGDDGLPGLGGPGGFDGGRGGVSGSDNNTARGGAGLGPGGGNGGRHQSRNRLGCGGGAAGFSINGNPSPEDGRNFGVCGITPGGSAYGSADLLPLIGGSGGGGGTGGFNFGGSGGGGGGGAILIAVSGTLTVNGTILARGGTSGNSAGTGSGGTGGGGAGGAIRLVATTISGNGSLNANRGDRGSSSACHRCSGGFGAAGRIKLEAETFNRTASTTPVFTFSGPQDVFVAGMPMLAISTVAGVAAPANPTGSADIVLPDTTANPVTVEFVTTNVPLGNTIDLTLTPATGDKSTAVTGAIAGTLENGTASTTIDLPDGPSTMSAEVSYTVVADNANAADYSRYADGEPVERIILRAGMGPQMASTTTFVTTSGKEFTWSSQTVALPN